jgi:hypothetical protein
VSLVKLFLTIFVAILPMAGAAMTFIGPKAATRKKEFEKWRLVCVAFILTSDQAPVNREQRSAIGDEETLSDFRALLRDKETCGITWKQFRNGSLSANIS